MFNKILWSIIINTFWKYGPTRRICSIWPHVSLLVEGNPSAYGHGDDILSTACWTVFSTSTYESVKKIDFLKVITNSTVPLVSKTIVLLWYFVFTHNTISKTNTCPLANHLREIINLSGYTTWNELRHTRTQMSVYYK